jgi:hypothetical protein
MDLLLLYFPSLASSGAIVDVTSSSPSEGLHVYSLSFVLKEKQETTVNVSSFNLSGTGGCVTGSLRLTRDK